MENQFFVYIITNRNRTVLYTGVTNSITRRIFEHSNKLNKGFSERYNIDRLVFYEIYGTFIDAAEREKQIKKYSRKKKESLVNSFNPKWNDLSNSF